MYVKYLEILSRCTYKLYAKFMPWCTKNSGEMGRIGECRTRVVHVVTKYAYLLLLTLIEITDLNLARR
jgi:hypothetical protein